MTCEEGWADQDKDTTESHVISPKGKNKNHDILVACGVMKGYLPARQVLHPRTEATPVSEVCLH
jgi:hypothetical protein